MESLIYPNKPKTNEFLLKVSYNTQVDNSSNKGQGQGWRQCNLTCAAMLSKYLKPTLWTQYSDFANGFQDVLQGDTTDHNAVTQALTTLGIKSYFSYTSSLADLQSSLYSGIPCLIGTAYKTGGHMILVIGRGNGYFIAHNPYGARRETSNEWYEIGGISGANEKLSATWMQQCFVDQGTESGWARFVTSVDGVSTGIKSAL
jgi:hypothetical protein